MKSVLVIGSGIHGLTVAYFLAKSGINVTIVDAKKEILAGTSAATHNRVNMGYHYPRSSETALECLMGYEYLKENYNSLLKFPKECYYFIDSNDSKVTADEYQYFCDQVGLKYELKMPTDGIINKEMVQGSFRVHEPCYDVDMFREYFKQKILEHNILTVLGFTIREAKVHNQKVFLKSERRQTFTGNFDGIVNCTYAATNNIQSIFGTEEPFKNYSFQKTEVAVVSCPYRIPPVTVMDGPFCTVLPYAPCENQYLLYDVEHSINKVEVGQIMPSEMYTPGVSKYPLMLNKASRYYPFMQDAVYEKSLWATRPIPLLDKTDNRTTNVVKHKNHKCFYSVLEGKFVSAPMLGEKIANQVMENL